LRIGASATIACETICAMWKVQAETHDLEHWEMSLQFLRDQNITRSRFILAAQRSANRVGTK